MRGIWHVESFVRNGETVPPLLTDSSRWGTVIFGDYRVMAVRTTANAPAGAWLVERATDPGSYTLTRADGSATAAATITFPDVGVMRLQTRLDENDLELRLHRVDERSFRLNSRGFRWISERSFNR
ncbi:MAG: hypothetical protein KIT44_02990 [Opitutaceae bacterium]|nr:hypothetical protein [Opitutaceae bacterium]